MNAIETTTIDCPYCGETIEIVIDCSVRQQTYIEDCEVCCRPITISYNINTDGSISSRAMHEDET